MAVRKLRFVYTGLAGDTKPVSAEEGAAYIELNSTPPAVFVMKAGTWTTSAVPVVFPATQVASAGANTLDDYEEGTWTPTIGGTATYTTQQGLYIKVGGLVAVTCNLEINVIGTGSTTTVSGLPFAATNENPAWDGAIGYFGSLAVNVLFFTAYVVANTATVRFTDMTAAGVTATDQPAVLGSATRVSFSMVYKST